MDKELRTLYKKIDDSQIFGDFNICKNCKNLCARKMQWHWLLSIEIQLFNYNLDISKKNEAFFFEGGKCPLLKDNQCSIYSKRPLECRLSPLSLLQLNEKFYWIIDIDCLYFKSYSKSKILNFINIIEPYFTKKMLDDIKNISNAININNPLIEFKDYIKLKEFYK
ncbi:MAG: YkgJ family cysteine cluster protein [Candidatus Cloacimonetes bacterium]|nr:YkgJ family cysteine cluster protein [Candidatus Cloacimonadota bacterium]